MKSILGIAVVLAVTATASAAVRVFVTTSSDPYGLTIPQNHNVPTYSTVTSDGANINAYDYSSGAFVCAAYPPIDAPSGTLANPVEILPGDWAYIWFQFQNEPKSVTVGGLTININGPAGFTSTYYVQNDRGGPWPMKRWDGTATPPGYSEWHNNPQTLVAITADGLHNPPPDNPPNMTHGQAGLNPSTSVALLGAIDNIGAGTYNIDITNLNYANFPTPDPANWVGGVFHMVPEPASALLLGLVSLLIRRRRSPAIRTATSIGVQSGVQ